MTETDSDPDAFEREQEKQAGADAGAIGGQVGDYPASDDDDGGSDPARRAVVEGGGGEAEGFELAERELEDHASHSDQHAARRVLEDAEGFDEDSRATDGADADAERTEPE